MDAVASSHASDYTLRGLGLKTGDILSLKAFVTDSTVNQKDSVGKQEREKLIEQLQSDQSNKSSGPKRIWNHPRLPMLSKGLDPHRRFRLGACL